MPASVGILMECLPPERQSIRIPTLAWHICEISRGGVMEQRTERHVNILSVYPGSDNGLESEQACCPAELKWCTK